MFASTMVLTVVGILYEDPALNAIVAIIAMMVLLTAFSLVLSPIVAKVNAFFLVQTSMGLSIGGASFYFYTDTKEQFPDGPHFSQEFYISVLGTVGSVCSLLGIFTYQKYMKDWSYHRLLLFTNVVLSVLSMSDVIFFKRLNVRWGIPDHAFVLGSSVCGTVVAQWMWMPGVVILSQLCPKGMEATMYALLAGCHNLGNTIASNCGACMLKWLHVEPSGAVGDADQFTNLWLASLLATVLPLVTLFLIPWLIPNAKQTDVLLDEGADATTGSLWSQLFPGSMASAAA